MPDRIFQKLNPVRKGTNSSSTSISKDMLRNMELSNGVNYKLVTRKICRFLKGEFKKRNKKVAVVGVSGGVDSAVTAKLCEKAGLDLRTIFMPYGTISTGPKNYSLKVDITKIVDQYLKEISKHLALDKIDKGNIMARTRMIVQYALTRQLNGLVVGTENLSEYYLGYFTIHGDQASDINPIFDLWKTQVMKLAEYLGLPVRKPSAELWEGQTDKKELGFSYEEADPILYLYCLKKLTLLKIIKDFDLKADLVYRVVDRVKMTEYKRREVPKYEPKQ